MQGISVWSLIGAFIHGPSLRTTGAKSRRGANEIFWGSGSFRRHGCSRAQVSESRCRRPLIRLVTTTSLIRFRRRDLCSSPDSSFIQCIAAATILTRLPSISCISSFSSSPSASVPVIKPSHHVRHLGGTFSIILNGGLAKSTWHIQMVRPLNHQTRQINETNPQCESTPTYILQNDSLCFGIY